MHYAKMSLWVFVRVCVYVHVYLKTFHILFSASGTLVCHGPSIPGQHKILEINKINNEPTTNGFHSHFNGIAIRVTLAWQPSGA